MIDVSTELRIAYFEKLSTIQIDGIAVPVFDETVNPNVPIPTIQGAKCYILILDQSETEQRGTMCNDREHGMITLKVVCKYPINSGGKQLTEEISNKIQELVRSNSFTSLLNTDLNIKRIRKVMAQGITEQGQSFTAYTKNIIYQNVINL